MKLIPSMIALLLIGSYSTIATAQDYYDDDIYYNPSKAKTKEKKSTKANSNSNVIIVDYPAADTYIVTGDGVNIDIDTYNRRGVFANDSINATSTVNSENFECTQQIERFYNPDVIVESQDETVAQIYYATPATDVNIYVGSPSWGFGYYPYYSSPWYWGTPHSWWYYNSWAYNPWYWDYGPYWSYPSWYWGYGGYYPYYHPPHHHGIAYHPGPSRPGGNYRPSGYHSGRTNNYRPGSTSNMHRPGSANNGYRNESSGGNYRPGRGTNRSNSSNKSYRSNNESNNGNNSYRPSSKNSSRGESSSSYRNSGSRNSGSGFRSGGGGGTRGGGGGGRGRR